MSYISQEDYKNLMSNFQQGTPKGLLKEMHSMKHDGADEHMHLQADAEEGLEKEGNAFTAGLAKTKKGGEFEVGGKKFKDRTNYDAPVKEDMEGEPKVIGHVKGDVYRIRTVQGDIVDLDFEAERGDEIDPPYTWGGSLGAEYEGYYYEIPAAFITVGGGQYDIEPEIDDLMVTPVKTTPTREIPGFDGTRDALNNLSIRKEYQFDQMYPDDKGPFEGEMEESHPGNDKWYEEFERAISAMGLGGEAEARVMKALDHTDPMTQYGFMTAPEAARDFVSDLGIVAADDYEDYDDDYPTDYGDAGADFNDGEFWEAEMKKLQEIAGVHSQDDGPEDDDEEAKEKRAKKMEMDDEEAENAEMDEEVSPTKSYHGSSANQGDTGETIDFTVIENTPEYFKIDYVITPNSSRKPIGASKYYTREKKYGEWKISKVGEDGEPLRDWEKRQINVKGDRFGVNGKEFVDDVYGTEKKDMPGFGGTWDALDKLSIKEETKEASDGSHMRDPAYAAKIVAQKHGKELKDLRDIYDTRSDAEPKVRNQAYKDYENAAISWCGHEMLEAGLKKVVVQNLLSGYGYFEDWAPDYLESLKDELEYGEMEEGFNPDESDFERAVAEELESLPAEDLTDEEYQKALELLEDPKVVSKLWDIHPRKAAIALAKMVRKTNEGLHMPPLQATGPTVDVNEGQGMRNLTPDERKQLGEYINSYKTIKSEISKLLEKAGKSGKIMENAKKAEDEKVPAERKAKYHNPTEVPVQHKHSNLGGNRTGLVMTKSEMWENEESEHERIEGMLDTRLHDAFHKVTGMIMKDLMADGFDEGDIKNFLQHEIDEKAQEAINAQHDF